MSAKNFALIMLMLVSANTYANSTNQMCITTSLDITQAKEVNTNSREYLNLLNNINFLSFKNTSASPETVASLVEEKNDLIESFEKIVQTTLLISNTSSQCVARDWGRVLYLLASSIRYMEDMEDFGLIKDCQVCWFSVVVLREAYQSLDRKFKNL